MNTATKKLYKTLEELIETRNVVGATGKKFNDISAASTQNNLLTLQKLMIDSKAKDTLEIGLAYGASCLTLASAHRNASQKPPKQHVAIALISM